MAPRVAGAILPSIVVAMFRAIRSIERISLVCYTGSVNNPKVSVVIAALNEAELLPMCLTSLIDQHTSFPFEIIVVDNGSTDETKIIAERFAAENENVVSLQELKRGTPKARNLGAKNARGNILVFTDADCTYPANWLEEIAKPFADTSRTTPIGVVGGSVTTAFRRADWPTLIEHFADSLFQLWEERDRTARFPGFLPWAPTCNLAVNKELFEDLGGFEENWTIGYDPDFCWRVALNGFTVLYHEPAEVFHIRRGTLPAILKQAYNYAYYNSALFSTYHKLWSFGFFETQKARISAWPTRFIYMLKQPRKFWPLSVLVFLARMIGKLRYVISPKHASRHLTQSRLGKDVVSQKLPPVFLYLHKQGYCHWLHEDELILFHPKNKNRLSLNPAARAIWEAKILGTELNLSGDALLDANELEKSLQHEGLLQ